MICHHGNRYGTGNLVIARHLRNDRLYSLDSYRAHAFERRWCCMDDPYGIIDVYRNCPAVSDIPVYPSNTQSAVEHGYHHFSAVEEYHHDPAIWRLALLDCSINGHPATSKLFLVQY